MWFFHKGEAYTGEYLPVRKAEKLLDRVQKLESLGNIWQNPEVPDTGNHDPRAWALNCRYRINAHALVTSDLKRAPRNLSIYPSLEVLVARNRARQHSLGWGGGYSTATCRGTRSWCLDGCARCLAASSSTYVVEISSIIQPTSSDFRSRVDTQYTWGSLEEIHNH